MLLPPVARGEVEGRRRIGGAEGAIVTHIGPDPARLGLALGQDRHRGVIGVQALRRQNVPGDQLMQRLHRRGRRVDLVGRRRDGEVDALAGVSITLAVQRLMLPELLEEDCRQQVRPNEAARRHMEGRRWLSDRLARAAAELSRTV